MADTLVVEFRDVVDQAVIKMMRNHLEHEACIRLTKSVRTLLSTASVQEKILGGKKIAMGFGVMMGTLIDLLENE